TGSALTASGSGFSVELNFSTRQGHVEMAAGRLYPLELCLRAAVIEDVEREGGLMLHASAVLPQGQAHVFFGPSGIGKTTVARYLGDEIAQDLVLIRRRDKQTLVFGSPFWGGRAVAGPLCALYALGRGDAVVLAPLFGAEAARRLLREVRHIA